MKIVLAIPLFDTGLNLTDENTLTTYYNSSKI